MTGELSLSLSSWRLSSILILNFPRRDVHHGNGTQQAFWDDENVLYISLHRYENGEFFPGGIGGADDQVGVGAGVGRNVNIPWPDSGMGDGDYLAAFQRVVMPIAHEFAPDFVIISAGFDAAEGDHLGQCRVTPNGYAQMTHELAALANGRLVVALEVSVSKTIAGCLEADSFPNDRAGTIWNQSSVRHSASQMSC